MKVDPYAGTYVGMDDRISFVFRNNVNAVLVVSRILLASPGTPAYCHTVFQQVVRISHQTQSLGEMEKVLPCTLSQVDEGYQDSVCRASESSIANLDHDCHSSRRCVLSFRQSSPKSRPHRQHWKSGFIRFEF